nr:c1q-like [uncultured Mediterranean phage uvMED]
MSYIGIPPQANFSSGLLDRFTSTTGTTVTLTHDIASENDIVVFVNFVKQDSTTYSVGGTGNKTLTLGGTLVSSDIVEVHYLNIVGQTNAPSSGSVGSSQISADVITGQTALAVAPDSTDELLISDGGTLKRIDVSLVGGTNTPAFKVYLGSNMTSVTRNTTTKITFDTEVYDTDSAFASNKFTVPSGKAGKYHFSAMSTMKNSSDYNFAIVNIYKNGNEVLRGSKLQLTDNYIGSSAYSTFVVTGDLDLSVSDYIEVYIEMGAAGGSGTILAAEKFTSFSGYKIIT